RAAGLGAGWPAGTIGVETVPLETRAPRRRRRQALPCRRLTSLRSCSLISATSCRMVSTSKGLGLFAASSATAVSLPQSASQLVDASTSEDHHGQDCRLSDQLTSRLID